MRAFGRGGQDFARALKHFHKAGHHAFYYLGVMHLYGHGVPVNYTRASSYFEQAAQLTEDPLLRERARQASRELNHSLWYAAQKSPTLYQV